MYTATIYDGTRVFACLAVLAAALMLIAAPSAKAWAADVIERLAHWACVELRSRASAQSVARITRERVYQDVRRAEASCVVKREPVVFRDWTSPPLPCAAERFRKGA
jgi:hypothetical protein